MANGVNRDERREGQWRRIIRQHAQSGLTIREFCRKSKLPESAFYFWRSELKRREAEQEQPHRRKRPVASAGPTPAPAFVPVRVAEEVAERPVGRIEIMLTGGRRVHVMAPVDRQALADVLAVLEGQAC